MEYNLPTNLTLLRIALIPVLVVVFYLPISESNEICVAIFILAALTDWLDGFLARRMGLQTTFGAFLDPVADKLMVVVVLVLIVQHDPVAYVAVPAAVIIGREITVASLREWMAELGQRTKVKVSWLGKLKTTFQMLSIIFLLYGDTVLGVPFRTVGLVLIYVASILTLWSMWQYIQAAWPEIKQ